MLQLARRKQSRKKFRRGHAPYLAKIRFYWCDTCNVPRIAETECSVCGSLAREVKLSPPGDPFPDMDGHLQRAINAIDSSTIQLIAKCLGWAKHRRRKAAAKMHMRLDLQSFLPSFAIIKGAGTHDSTEAYELCADLKAGEIVVADKAYVY